MKPKPTMLDIAKRTDDFFMKQSPIHDTMIRLSTAMNECEICFAIAGAMAANAHGHHRTTADVDVLLKRDDLQQFKDRWLGLDWIEKPEGSKGFKDTQNDVPVDVLIAGDFPGDGLEKPVAFPDPKSVSEILDGKLPFVRLSTLIELKLASGMTAAHRPRDLDDVIQLIRINKLELDYVSQLNPYVHDTYQKMWTAAQVNEDY